MSMTLVKTNACMRCDHVRTLSKTESFSSNTVNHIVFYMFVPTLVGPSSYLWALVEINHRIS